MFRLLIALACVGFPYLASAEEFQGEGSWVETLRGSRGPLNCFLVEGPDNQWVGRFVGIYQGSEFDYQVRFQGQRDDLNGTSVISGIEYRWRGGIEGDVLTGKFISVAGNPPRRTRDGIFTIRRIRR